MLHEKNIKIKILHEISILEAEKIKTKQEKNKINK